MKNAYITRFEQRHNQVTAEHPKFRPGDTVRVHYKIQEGSSGKDGKEKFRVQQFEGVCIRFKKGTMDASFTVRKVGAGGVGVERVFPLFSPYIEKIDLVAGGIVRRSRLYYLRERFGKAARIKSRYVGAKRGQADLLQTALGAATADRLNQEKAASADASAAAEA